MSERRKRLSENLKAYAFLAPSALFWLVFFFIPVIWLIQYSFYDFQFTTASKFIGTGYYARLFRDGVFQRALLNTFKYAIIQVPSVVLISFILANLINQTVRGITLFRLIYYIPVVTSMVIVGTTWRWMYQTDGLLNAMLKSIGLSGVAWLTNPRAALPSVAGVGVWKSAGYFMMLYFAGLQSIPNELFEAAVIDGANWLQRIVHITIPQVKRFTVMIVLLAFIEALQVFSTVMVMTEGGPGGATDVVSFFVYRQAFQFLKFGYANAAAMILLVVTALASVVYFYVVLGRGQSEDL